MTDKKHFLKTESDFAFQLSNKMFCKKKTQL